MNSESIASYDCNMRGIICENSPSSSLQSFR